MTLTFNLYLDILPLDIHAKFQAHMSVHSAVNVRHMDTQTQDAKTITPAYDNLQTCVIKG